MTAGDDAPPKDSPQLASLESLPFDGDPYLYEGVTIYAEPIEWGDYNLLAVGRGQGWYLSVPTKAKARAMFAAFVAGDLRGWIAFDDDRPVDPASFTAGPGPASLGAYVWLREDGIHDWFDADGDTAAIADAQRMCLVDFDRSHTRRMSYEIYRTGTDSRGRGYLVGVVEFRVE